MKCSKPRFIFRPQVENLESRLQPGSVLSGSGYGWSLLADHLSILNQGSPDAQSQVAPSSSDSTIPSQAPAPVETHRDNLDIAIISLAAARSQNASTPGNTSIATPTLDLLP